MSRFNLLCSCGHLVQTGIYYEFTMPDVPSQLPTYQARTLCPSCCQKQCEEHPLLQIKPTLCQLVGSPFQVAWALDIRKRHMNRFAQLVREHPTGIADDLLDAMIVLVNERNHARWWIDHHENTFRPMIPDCRQSIRKLVIRAAYESVPVVIH